MQIPCPLMTWKLVSVFFCLGAFIAFITVIKSMDCQLSKTNPARPEGLHLKPLELGKCQHGCKGGSSVIEISHSLASYMYMYSNTKLNHAKK